MKRLLGIALALMLVISLAACGGGGSGAGTDSGVGNSGATTEKTSGETVTTGNITHLVPEGWRVKAGSAGGIENDNSLFLLSTDSDAPFLWIQIVDADNRDSSLESGDGELDPFTAGDMEWSGKQNIITATADDGTIWLVRTAGMEGFESNTVRDVLGSIKAAK